MRHETDTRKQALREAREILLAAKRNGGRGLEGAWSYLRDELDAVSTPCTLCGATLPNPCVQVNGTCYGGG